MHFVQIYKQGKNQKLKLGTSQHSLTSDWTICGETATLTNHQQKYADCFLVQDMILDTGKG